MAKKSENLTGLRAWRTNTLTLPQFPMLRVGVGKAPLFDSQKRIAAKMVSPDTGTRLERRYFDSSAGSLFTDAEVKKVYEHEGVDVELTPSELESLKADSDKDVALVALVEESTLHPEFYEKSYELWPLTKTDADGYKLLAWMLRDGKALVGTVIEDGTTKAYVVRWSALTETLVAHVLNYERNLRWGQVETVQRSLAAIEDPSPEMVAMASTIFDSLPTEFDSSSVDDEYAARLEAAIASKAKGEAVKVEAKAPASSEPADLLAALRASVEAANVSA